MATPMLNAANLKETTEDAVGRIAQTGELIGNSFAILNPAF